MYQEFLVPIPCLPGKIILKKANRVVYVLYETGRTYDPKKQFNIPQRVLIGKRSEQNSSEMYPNERCFEYFPELNVHRSSQETTRSSCLDIGPYLVIEKVIDQYKIAELAKKWFKKDAGLFLDLVCYLIITEDNAGQYYPDYAFRHPLFTESMKVVSDSKVSRFLTDMTKEQIRGFIDDWNNKRDHRTRIYLHYDSTNKNSQAGDLDFVEFGNPKDDKGLPIFNLSLAFDKDNRIPLFYEAYPGSINDVSQLKFLIDKISEYGYRHVGFILDRGYFSKENIQYMDKKKYPFIMMLEGRKPLVRSLIDQNRTGFESSRDCLIEGYSLYGKTLERPLFENSVRSRYIHMYFSASKMAAERERIEQRIRDIHRVLTRFVGKSIRFGKPYTDYFDCFYQDNCLINFTEKADVIQSELNSCGYFFIVSSEKMNATEAYELYKNRDVNEKLFRSDKTFLGSRSMRIQSNNALEAKLLIEFTALIIRNKIYNVLKEQMKLLSKKPNYLTVPAAIKELGKIQIVRFNNENYLLDHAVTKIQQTILQPFEIKNSDVIKKSNELSLRLKKGIGCLEPFG